MNSLNNTVPTRYVIIFILFCPDNILFYSCSFRCKSLTSPLSCQVLVIIDVKPKDLGLPTEAYISVEEIHDVSDGWFQDVSLFIPK